MIHCYQWLCFLLLDSMLLYCYHLICIIFVFVYVVLPIFIVLVNVGVTLLGLEWCFISSLWLNFSLLQIFFLFFEWLRQLGILLFCSAVL